MNINGGVRLVGIYFHAPDGYVLQRTFNTWVEAEQFILSACRDHNGGYAETYLYRGRGHLLDVESFPCKVLGGAVHRVDAADI